MAQKQPQLTELSSLIFAMGRFMRDRMQKTMAHTACPSLVHLEALRYVGENKRPLMRDVARSFHITPPAATLLINSLVEEKLLARVVDTKDRRTVRVVLTPAGKRLLARGIADRKKALTKLFSVLTSDEQRKLIAILSKIVK